MKAGVFVATALVAMTGQAKEHYVVKEEITTKDHVRPNVEATTQRCAYDTASFRLCGQYGAQAQVGWEWVQEFYALSEEEKSYKLKLELFTKQGLDLTGLLFAERLYQNELFVTLTDFKMLLTFQLTRWYKSNRLCFAMFYALDELIFDIIMRMRFPEANKRVIETPWTMDNWTSPYALWLDEWGLSDYAPIEIYKKEIQQKDAQTMIYGTINDEDAGCSPGVFNTFLS